MEEKLRISVDYQYDKNNRLVKCLVQGEKTNEYSYDPAGNLLFCGDASLQRQRPATASAAPIRNSPGASWSCDCGCVNTGKFCVGCGQLKPEQLKQLQSDPVKDGGWLCTCGRTNKGSFCPICGTKRSSISVSPAKENRANGSWLCSCGRTNKASFCCICGSKRPQ